MRVTLRVTSPPGRCVLRLAATAAALNLATHAFPATASGPPRYLYVSPSPGSRYVSTHNNIVLRGSDPLDGALDAGVLSVVGALSGPHTGRLTISDDRRTLVFVPHRPFAHGERVDVKAEPGLKTRSGERLPELRFDFVVEKTEARARRPVPSQAEALAASDAPPQARPNAAPSLAPLPVDYPPIIFIPLGDAGPERLFMTPNPPGSDARGNLVILDDHGQPLFHRNLPQRALNFQMQPSGLLTYFDFSANQFYAMDSSHAVVDSFTTGNGYEPDFHELQLLDNGHALMMALDLQPVRMDSVVAGGDSSAIVVGLILQELDLAKNVVFQWRSWDHFQILDAVECTVDFTSSTIDYVHANAIEQDHDGNLLLSSRHMNEITKIDRATGDVIWRLGLNAINNQFNFVGDSRGFSHQHDIRRLPNGNITLYDNGNCLSPEYSRGLEYALDEVNKVATLVWEFVDTPTVFGRATGNLQRRSDGSTLINWGHGAKVTDLDPADAKSFEVYFGATNMRTYRAFRFPWSTSQFAVSPDTIEFGEVAIGDTVAVPLSLHNRSKTNLEIDGWVTLDSLAFRVLDPPNVLNPGESVTVHVAFQPHHPGPVRTMLYARAVNDTELVAQSVALSGTATGTAFVQAPETGLGLLGVAPSPSRGITRLAFALAREGRVRIDVSDVRGRIVARVVDGVFPSGRHEAVWSAGEQPAGLYFVRYASEDGTGTRRLAVIR